MRTRTLLTLIACTVIFGVPASASAATTYHLAAQRIDSDSFDNYDFSTPKVSSKNVDWPITLLFRNNAEVDKVKQKIGWGIFASAAYARLNNSFGWFYDSDQGIKSAPCTVGVTAVHFRVYADQGAGDRNYSPSLGYYVLGTTHLDRNECGGGTKTSGWSELAEETISNMYSVRGWTIYRNTYQMNNPETPRLEGNHYWNNSGLATIVAVP